MNEDVKVEQEKYTGIITTVACKIEWIFTNLTLVAQKKKKKSMQANQKLFYVY